MADSDDETQTPDDAAMSITETEDDFEEWDNDAADGAEANWEQKQRELVISVLDYNLNTLVELITNGQIDLSPRYQRRDRWRPDRQSRLIESFLMNVPVPQIFLNEDEYGKYSVIDGKQRLTAVSEFMRGRLKLTGLQVFPELNGMTIDDVSPSLRSIVSTRANLRATIILRQSDKEVKFEVFRRLNTGGVTLNPQEIRNSTWPGPLNELLLDLSEEPRFTQLLGITRQATSRLYKEMRDVELVLRFFAFREDWSTFRGGMAKRLDAFMADYQRASKRVLTEMRTSFLNALEVSEAAFGPHAFRRFIPETSTWRSPVLAALYDAHMFTAMAYKPEEVKAQSAALNQGYELLFSDPEFRRAIDAATNTPALFKSRITLMRSMFEEVLDR